MSDAYDRILEQIGQDREARRTYQQTVKQWWHALQKEWFQAVVELAAQATHRLLPIAVVVEPPIRHEGPGLGGAFSIKAKHIQSTDQKGNAIRSLPLVFRLDEGGVVFVFSEVPGFGHIRFDVKQPFPRDAVERVIANYVLFTVREQDEQKALAGIKL